VFDDEKQGRQGIQAMIERNKWELVEMRLLELAWKISLSAGHKGGGMNIRNVALSLIGTEIYFSFVDSLHSDHSCFC